MPDTALTTRDPFATLQVDPQKGLMFAPHEVFQRGMGMARLLVASKLVPSHLTEEACFLALDIAARTGQHPLAVCQSMYEVQGRPGWTAAYLIAQAKARGYSIRWQVEDRGEAEFAWQAKGKSPAGRARLRVLTVTACVPEDESMRAEVTTEMAEAEGWLSNPKYRSMLQRMLQFRAATFLVRDYLPDVALGLPVVEELETMHVVDATPSAPVAGPAALRAALGDALHGEVYDLMPEEDEDEEESEERSEEQAKRRLRVEISDLRSQLAALDSGAVARVKAATGIQRLPDTSDLARFELLRDALARELARCREIAEEPSMVGGHPESDIVPPEDCEGRSEVERTVGHLLTALGDAAEPIRREHGAGPDLGWMDDVQLADYAQALYTAWWATVSPGESV